MATRAERLAGFTTDREPQPGCDVELLCEDHNGTYVLPFPCRRAEGTWLNPKTGENVEAEVLGWRAWEERRGGRAGERTVKAPLKQSRRCSKRKLNTNN